MFTSLVFLGITLQDMTDNSIDRIRVYICVSDKHCLLSGGVSVSVAEQLHNPPNILSQCSMRNQWIPEDSHLYKSCYPCVVFWYSKHSAELILGMCLSDNVTPVRCSTDIWNFASGAQGVDPLMVAETAKSLIESVVAPFLIILVITLGLTSLIMTMVLFLPMVFSWRHARNLHFLCIVMAGASAFLLFVEILITKLGILGGMYGVFTTSLQVVTVKKGVLSEAFLWTAWVLWLFAFLFVWWVRWWEILERRETKKAAKKKAEDDKKKAEEEKKKQAALKDKPMKAEDAVLQQMAAAQM